MAPFSSSLSLRPLEKDRAVVGNLLVYRKVRHDFLCV